MRYKRGKKGIESHIIGWIIALVVLAFAVILGILLRKQLFELLDQLKNFLRFGR